MSPVGSIPDIQCPAITKMPQPLSVGRRRVACRQSELPLLADSKRVRLGALESRYTTETRAIAYPA